MLTHQRARSRWWLKLLWVPAWKPPSLAPQPADSRWVIWPGDSPGSPLDLPPSLSSFQITGRDVSNGLCISWYPQGWKDVGRTDNECVSGDPLKCQACLCWLGPRLLHVFKEKSPIPAIHRLGLRAHRTYLAEFLIQSTLHFQGEKMPKAWYRVSQHEHSSNS